MCIRDRKIPYAFIDFNMEQTHALCYIGQDSKVSGYIAAKILVRREQWDGRYVKRSEQIRLLCRTKADGTSLAMAGAFYYNIKDSRARGADNPALCMFVRWMPETAAAEI